MKLVLHIGTHKTGTTAIQRFLSSNRRALAELGYHYAATGSGLNANAIADAIGAGHDDVGRDFFNAHVEMARQSGCHTVVVSAENLYVMSVVQAALAKRHVVDFAAQERAAVQRVKHVLPPPVSETRIVCYVRRPDRYLESLYNQRIKYETYDEPFDRFLQMFEPALSYNEVGSFWSGVFGQENCTFTTYESVVGDIRLQFLHEVLQLADAGFTLDADDRDNERLSRDVLEFKRELNRTTPENQRDVAYRVACLLEQEMSLLEREPAHYQQFLSPELRKGLLDRLAADTARLQAAYNLPAFPAFDPEHASSTWAPYPGLDDARRAEIRQHYQRISGRAGFRRERIRIRASAALRRNRAGRLMLAAWRKSGINRAVRLA